MGKIKAKSHLVSKVRAHVGEEKKSKEEKKRKKKEEEKSKDQGMFVLGSYVYWILKLWYGE